MPKERRVPVENLLSYVSKDSLFNHTWGLKKVKFKKDEIRSDLENIYAKLSEFLVQSGLKGILYYDSFPVEIKEDCIFFPVQQIKWYFPKVKGRGLTDNHSGAKGISLQIATFGKHIDSILQKLEDSGEISRQYYIHGLSLWLTEALAEYGHDQLKQEQKYSGKKERYSFGYPLCPDLAMQDDLFRLLQIKDHHEVSLTTNYMMVPQQSTSAIVLG